MIDSIDQGIFKAIKRNMSYAFFANLFSIIISVAMIFIVPKFVGEEDYGKWQLFLFYFYYLGFFHFGWLDGIYLRYAGQTYEELDKKLVSGQFCGLILLQTFIIIFGGLLVIFFVSDTIKQIVLLDNLIMLPLVMLITGCSFILQITNRIEDYAKQLVLENATLLFFILMAIFAGYWNYSALYLMKFISLIFVVIFCIIRCREIFQLHFYSFKDILVEAKVNISTGSKLMLANIAGMLMLGVVRYGISVGWDIRIFGKVSLMLSVCNFLVVFIKSISVVLFPVLKKLQIDLLAVLYGKLRLGLAALIMGLWLCFYPIAYILEWWLPNYADAIAYMVMIFPICLFASRIGILINTYYNSLRKETWLLRVNGWSVLVSVGITFWGVKIMHDLRITVLGIVVVYCFTSFLAELYLQKWLQISILKEYAWELLLMCCFIGGGLNLDRMWAFIVYIGCYIVYLLLHWKYIRSLRMMIVK